MRRYCPTQYTDSWTCHLHNYSRFTTPRDITPPHSSRLCSKPPTHSPPTPPIPPQPKHRHTFNTPPVPTGLVNPNPILSSTHLSPPTPPEPNTYTFHTLHQLLSSHAPHLSLARLLLLTATTVSYTTT